MLYVDNVESMRRRSTCDGPNRGKRDAACAVRRRRLWRTWKDAAHFVAASQAALICYQPRTGTERGEAILERWRERDVIEPLYVLRVMLLDALDALGDHREALILAGRRPSTAMPSFFIDGEKIQTLTELFARRPC